MLKGDPDESVKKTFDTKLLSWLLINIPTSPFFYSCGNYTLVKGDKPVSTQRNWLKKFPRLHPCQETKSCDAGKIRGHMWLGPTQWEHKRVTVNFTGYFVVLEWPLSTRQRSITLEKKGPGNFLWVKYFLPPNGYRNSIYKGWEQIPG